jgi:hypothetical protein
VLARPDIKCPAYRAAGAEDALESPVMKIRRITP